jgi:hypothetical protein
LEIFFLLKPFAFFGRVGEMIYWLMLFWTLSFLSSLLITLINLSLLKNGFPNYPLCVCILSHTCFLCGFWHRSHHKHCEEITLFSFLSSATSLLFIFCVVYLFLFFCVSYWALFVLWMDIELFVKTPVFHVRSLPVFPAFFFCSATLPPPYPLLFRVDFFLVTPHSWPIVGHGWGDQLGLFHDFDYCFLVWTPNSARSVLEMCFSSVFGSEWGVDSCWSHWGCRPSES